MLIDMFCLLALRLAEKSSDDDGDEDTAQQEELCVFLISALTNLSFYADGHVHDSRERICKHLVNVIVLYVVFSVYHSSSKSETLLSNAGTPIETWISSRRVFVL